MVDVRFSDEGTRRVLAEVTALEVAQSTSATMADLRSAGVGDEQIVEVVLEILAVTIPMFPELGHLVATPRCEALAGCVAAPHPERPDAHVTYSLSGWAPDRRPRESRS